MRIEISLPEPFQSRVESNEPHEILCGLREYADTLNEFIKQHKFLYDIHGADYFVKSRWNGEFHASFPDIPALNDSRALDVFPLEWARFFDEYEWTTTELISLVRDRQFPAGVDGDEGLVRFINKVHDLALLRVPKEAGRIYEKNKAMLRMKVKKQIEIAPFAELVDSLCDDKSAVVVDVGAGQGYLSSLLAYDYGYDVIALDQSSHQTEGAERRLEVYDQKLRMDCKGSITVRECFIGQTTELSRICEEEGVKSGRECVLCGLHACGNLTPTIIRTFFKQSCVRLVTCLGCCYNMLTETGEEDLPGFPMSEHLQGVQLGYVARTLAAQSICRWGTTQSMRDVEYMFRRHFFRAVMQAMLFAKQHIHWEDSLFVKVGKFKSQKYFDDFSGYCRIVAERLFKDRDYFSQAEIDEFFQAYEGKAMMRIKILWSLRAILSLVLESLILVDRVIFAVEEISRLENQQKYTVGLIPLVDPKISPRNMMIVISRLNN